MSNDPIFPSKTSILFFIGAILFLLIYPLDILPLKFEEPRRALVAAEMIISGNFWAPTINGEFYYNKPPFFNWVLVGIFKILGFSNGAERLPTLLSILGISLTTFYFFKNKVGKEVAGLASLFFALSGHMLFYFSFQGEIDMTYSLIVFLQTIAIIYFFEKRKWAQLFLLSYLLMTVGFLMKGLPSIAFQGLTLLGIFIMNKQFSKLLHPAHFIALAFSILLLVGYFYQYSNYNDPELLIAKLTVESASRTTSATSISSYFMQLVKFPLLILSITLPGSLMFLFFKHFNSKEAWENKWIRYILIFLIFNIPIYWISPGTRDRYLYMFLPFIYLVVAFLATKAIKQYRKPSAWVLYLLGSVIGLGLLVVPFFAEGVSYLWSVLSALFIASALLLVGKKYIHPVYGVLIVMGSMRFFYNQVVFPIRTQSDDNIAATFHAKKVLEITKDQPLYFLGSKDSTILKLPFREPVVLEEIERLPYQFSYYYSSESHSIIQWVDEAKKEGFYVSAAELQPDAILYSFNMEGREFVLTRK